MRCCEQGVRPLFGAPNRGQAPAEEAAERNLRAGLVNTVHALARAVDAKDGYTHSHSQSVARYAAELGHALGLREERIEQLRTAGVLHDVGKIGIPDAVLLKPAKLEDAEFAVMHCADALEAMTSSRIYRPGMGIERALAELERGAGSQFDPHVAAVLAALVRDGQLRIDHLSEPSAAAA